MGQHVVPASDSSYRDNPFSAARRKHAIATEIAAACGALHFCALHLTGIYRGDCPAEQAIRFAAEAYDRDGLSEIFSTREELLDFVRDVVREHDRNDCLICHNVLRME